MAALNELEDVVREKVERERWTYKKLSTHLLELYPGAKGFGVRSVRRFCCLNNIRRTSRLSDGEVDIVVSGAVAKVSAYRLLQRRGQRMQLP